MLFKMDEEISEKYFKDNVNLVYSFDLNKYLNQGKFSAENKYREFVFTIWDDSIYTLIGPENIEETKFLNMIYNEIKSFKFFVNGTFYENEDFISFMTEGDLFKDSLNFSNKLPFNRRGFLLKFFLKLLQDESVEIKFISIFNSVQFHYKTSLLDKRWFISIDKNSAPSVFISYKDAFNFIENELICI